MSDKEMFGVNFETVLSSKHVSALTKMTVLKLKTNQYMTFAEFLQGLSDSDLEGLVRSFDKLSTDDHVVGDVILLAEIVASGEGDSVFDIDDVDQRMGNLGYFVNVVTCESLKRKGLITLDYSKITFDPAFKDEIFARVI
jgi:hypothetical protein